MLGPRVRGRSCEAPCQGGSSADMFVEVDPTTSSDPVAASEDPFANQRSPDDDPFANQRVGDSLPDLAASPPSSPEMPRDRRMSKEWGKLITEGVECSDLRLD